MSRRRCNVIREPNGRASRAGAVELLPPTEMCRLFDAATTGLRDPQFGSMLGRVHLTGKITRAEFAAGKRWAELTTEYNIFCEAPRPRKPSTSTTPVARLSILTVTLAAARLSVTPAPARAPNAPSNMFASAKAHQPGSSN